MKWLAQKARLLVSEAYYEQTLTVQDVAILSLCRS